MYGHPDFSKPKDALAHSLSEIINDGAPLGWEKYRGPASCLLSLFEIKPKANHPNYDKIAGTFDENQPRTIWTVESTAGRVWWDSAEGFSRIWLERDGRFRIHDTGAIHDRLADAQAAAETK